MRLRAWSVAMLVMGAAAAAAEFAVDLGDPARVPDAKPGVPIYPWFPDGHITVLPCGERLQMYWAGASSYRTTGLSVETMRLTPETPLLAGGKARDDFDNGGAWLMSVIPLTDTFYLGFYHAEDHEWETGRSKEGVAWKSIAHCSSADGGLTWKKNGQIITSARSKPAAPQWGGCGDHCVVYDKNSSRWFCFFQEHFICSAVSDDAHAAPGTWRKWDGSGFAAPGLGGKSSPVKELQSHPGGNPSVHFNTHLQRWVMVWHTWSGSLVYSSSRDLVRWEAPVVLLQCAPHQKCWYPTIVGESDTLAGENAALYYAFWPDKNGWQRQFLRRQVRFIVPGGSVGTNAAPAAGSDAAAGPAGKAAEPKPR